MALPVHRTLRPLTDASALTAKVAPLLASPVEFFAVDIGGGVSLDAWMYRVGSPINFAEGLKGNLLVVHGR